MILLIITLFLLQSNNLYAQEDLPFRDVTLAIVHDSYMDSQNNDYPGRDKYLQVGEFEMREFYINYDITPLTDLNILSKDLIHAHLQLYHEDNTRRNPLDISIYPITEFWHEQTMTTRPPVGDMLATQEIHGQLNQWQEIDISELAKYALDNKEDHYGFVVRSLSPSTSLFWSKDCTKGTRLPLCKVEEKPFITVRYWQNSLPSKPVLLSPANQLVTEKFKHTFTWEPSIDAQGEDIQYMFELSTDQEFTDILTHSPWIKETSFTFSLPGIDEYFWRIRARDEHLENGEVISDAYVIDLVQKVKIIKEVQIIEVPKITLKDKIVYVNQEDPKEESIGEILGIQDIREEIKALFTKKADSNQCEVNFIEGELSQQKCTLSNFELDEVTHKKVEKEYLISFTGRVDDQVSIKVKNISCREWSLFDPTTWFTSCKEASVEKTDLDINLDTVFFPKYDKKRLSLVSHRVYKGKFDLTYSSELDLSQKKVTLYRNSFATRYVDGNNFEIEKLEDIQVPVPDVVITTPTYSDGFGFPFKEWIGVTQWHGNTAYQSPHTGIDFGVTKKPIYSPADGYIRSAKWDDYYGRCLSGGNVLRIEHDNGKHSVYMHLDNYNNSKGAPWKVGGKVRKGELIGLTGNSGKYNCQRLGYHLHFEIRDSRAQSTHTDPVKQIPVDWEMIPTLGASSYPGRLTGDNPHPGR